MTKLLFLTLTVFCSISSQITTLQGQESEPLNREWVRVDVEGTKFLIGLTPIENHSVASLKKQFNADVTDNRRTIERDLGFGAKLVRLSKALGYSRIYVDILAFDNQIAHYKIGVDGSQREWPYYGVQIIRQWQNSKGPPFLQNGSELSYEKHFDSVWKSYYQKVGLVLGPMKPTAVPDNLRASYEYLISPLENSTISDGDCSEGKPAIDTLVDAKRVDLIENVLRGYNPGGRIYAAIALLRMGRKGLKLSQRTQKTLKKVINLDIKVSVCSGDLGIGGLRPSRVIRDFVESTKW